MALGLSRSVLSGAARQGVGVVRGAVTQKRQGTTSVPRTPRSDGNYVPYTPPPDPRPVIVAPPRIDPRPPQKAPTPRIDPQLSQAPTPGIDLKGSGGPGGYYDRHGTFIPYSYEQNPEGPYSGFNQKSALIDAITGRSELLIQDLAKQAQRISEGYETSVDRIGDKASARRAELYARQNALSPTFGDFEPELFDLAYAQASPDINDDVRWPTRFTREAFAATPVFTIDPTPEQLRMGSLVTPRLTYPSIRYPGISVPFGRVRTGVEEPFWPSPANLDAMIRARVRTGDDATLARARALVPEEFYTGDWYEQMRRDFDTAAAAVRPEFDAVNEWARMAREDEDARWRAALDEVAQLEALPENLLYQQVATNAYGVNPWVAAGMFGDEWQRAREDAEDAAWIARANNQLDIANLEEDIARYEETGMTPAQITDAVRAAEEGRKEFDELNTAAEFDKLSDLFESDARATLRRANLTLDQANALMELTDNEGNLLFDQVKQALMDSLGSKLGSTGILDERDARDTFQLAYQYSPPLARLFAALYPELAPPWRDDFDYLVGEPVGEPFWPSPANLDAMIRAHR